MTTPEWRRETPTVQSTDAIFPGCHISQSSVIVAMTITTYREQIVDIDDNLSLLKRQCRSMIPCALRAFPRSHGENPHGLKD